MTKLTFDQQAERRSTLDTRAGNQLQVNMMLPEGKLQQGMLVACAHSVLGECRITTLSRQELHHLSTAAQGWVWQSRPVSRQQATALSAVLKTLTFGL